MCGVFIKRHFKLHAQRLTAMGITNHLDEFEFMRKPQPQLIVMGCSQCGSFSHGCSPPGTCPNDTHYEEYAEKNKNGTLVLGDDFSPDELKRRQALPKDDVCYISPCTLIQPDGFPCFGIGHREEHHERAVFDDEICEIMNSLLY